MKERMRRHVCEYCPQVILIPSAKFDEVYGNNLVPLRMCIECNSSNKHIDKREKESIMIGINDPEYNQEDMPY